MANHKAGTLFVGGNNGKRNNEDVQVTEGSGSRFWKKMMFFLGCVALRSQEDTESTRSKSTTGEVVTKRKGDAGKKPVAPASSPKRRSRSAKSRNSPNVPDEVILASSQLRRFCFNDLKLATRNFKAELFLGRGGFGAVLKGWVSQHGNFAARPGAGIPVAVKCLNPEGYQGHREWLAEIRYLGKLHHPNLVKLVGYCIEDDKRLLVYEFMSRGSLENHLFRSNPSLPWAIRMKVLLGVAKGVAFLHEETARPVIFRDLKTSNILLDRDFNAKLSDFGLAKDAPVGDASHVSTRVMGTQGYAAPEYVMTGHLTPKSDVYSFGMVLLELLTGRRAVDRRRPRGQQSLMDWLRPQLRRKAALNYLMDPRLEGNFSMEGAYTVLHLAIQCLHPDPKERPRMSEVVRVLKKSNPLLGKMDGAPLSLQGLQVGPSRSNHAGANRYGLRTGSSSNVPRRFQASPLDQSYPLPAPNPGVGRVGQA